MLRYDENTINIHVKIASREGHKGIHMEASRVSRNLILHEAFDSTHAQSEDIQFLNL